MRPPRSHPHDDHQVDRMRHAIERVATVGPSFLRGVLDADSMAHTMMQTVHAFVEAERAAGAERPYGPEAEALGEVLSELMACGSGYLAGRCDAACVARTIHAVVEEFGSSPDAKEPRDPTK